MGDRLRFARESAEFSLEGVGEALGITGSAVSQWETGRTYPSRKSLLQFAELTGFGAMWLESGAGDAQARDKKLWLHSNMVPLITPSQAADANDIRTFLAGFHKELQLGPSRKLSADYPPVITSRFPCSREGGFALEIFDRRNATEYEIGDIIILDADVEPVPGDMVFAAVDAEKRPAFAKYLPRGPHTILKPINSDWGDEVVGPGYLEGRVIAVMTERIHRRRMIHN
jgi:transcriptional regulator with XRE-family HTH domain